MNDSAKTSPRLWIAAVGLACTFAAGALSFLIGLVTLGGVLVTVGGWKSTIEYRVTTNEAATEKRFDAIEHDRGEKIQDAARFRSETNSTLSELKTISAQNSKQIDQLTELMRREQGKR